MNEVHLHAILDALHDKKPLRIEETETQLEKLFKRPARYLLGCSVVSFLALGLVAACVWWFDLSSDKWLAAGFWLFIVSSSTAIIWMIVDIIPDVVGLFFFKDDLHRTRKMTLIHDLRHAEDLHRFDIPDLRLADQWLSLRIERMRLHLGLVIGGADKVAVLGLVLGAWAIWTSFPGSGFTLEQFAYMAGSAFIGGLGIGGLFANVVIKELAYQRDLLTLALSTVRQ